MRLGMYVSPRVKILGAGAAFHRMRNKNYRWGSIIEIEVVVVHFGDPVDVFYLNVHFTLNH